jgi:hypothetical protein
MQQRTQEITVTQLSLTIERRFAEQSFLSGCA